MTEDIPEKYIKQYGIFRKVYEVNYWWSTKKDRE